MTLSMHVRRSTLHPCVGSRPIGRLSRSLMTIPLLCGMFACQFPHHGMEGARINDKAKAQTVHSAAARARSHLPDRFCRHARSIRRKKRSC